MQWCYYIQYWLITIDFKFVFNGLNFDTFGEYGEYVLAYHAKPLNTMFDFYWQLQNHSYNIDGASVWITSGAIIDGNKLYVGLLSLTVNKSDTLVSMLDIIVV